MQTHRGGSLAKARTHAGVTLVSILMGVSTLGGCVKLPQASSTAEMSALLERLAATEKQLQQLLPPFHYDNPVSQRPFVTPQRTAADEFPADQVTPDAYAKKQFSERRR